jgi:hypothetical protein
MPAAKRRLRVQPEIETRWPEWNLRENRSGSNEKQLAAKNSPRAVRDFSRDDKTALELFIAVVRDWEINLRRLINT